MRWKRRGTPRLFFGHLRAHRLFGALLFGILSSIDMFDSRFLSSRLAVCGLLLSLTTAYAADPVVVEGAGVTVTASDLDGDMQRIPAESRKAVMSQPDSVAQMASNLYVRRALAAEAEKAGLAADPIVAAALRLARDRVLSDAQLARIDEANKPDEAALERYASNAYKAEPARFAAPEQTRVRHILIRTATTDARAKAEKLLAELKGGADFDALARTHSEDPGSAVRGGDLGFFGPGRMVSPFEEAVKKLQKPGDLSGIVETQFGFHIIRFEERRSAGQLPYSEVKEALRQEGRNALVSEVRGREARRLVEAARFDRPAIEAFAAQQR